MSSTTLPLSMIELKWQCRTQPLLQKLSESSPSTTPDKTPSVTCYVQITSQPFGNVQCHILLECRSAILDRPSGSVTTCNCAPNRLK